jgi:hypothetical protein
MRPEYSVPEAIASSCAASGSTCSSPELLQVTSTTARGTVVDAGIHLLASNPLDIVSEPWAKEGLE